MPSPDQRDYAALLLRKANEDLVVVRALIDNAEIADDVIGFHAQQTIEKALKAVLAIHRVEFPRTHDLRFLLQLVEDHDVDVPAAVAAARWLTPWAAEFRYDEPEAATLDRAESLESAERAIEWARSVVEGTA